MAYYSGQLCACYIYYTMHKVSHYIYKFVRSLEQHYTLYNYDV